MDRSNLGTLFMNEALSDFSILCKNEISSLRFPVQSLVLSMHSPVFKAMLNSDLEENRTKCIEISDISPQIIEKILRYMYFEKVHLGSCTEATEVLMAAHKYEIEPLVQKCSTYLGNKLRLDNALSIYQTASVYSLESLLTKSLQLILTGGFLFLKSPSFNMLSKDEVTKIVSDQNLNVDSEVTVCKALHEWSIFNCGRESKEVNDENIKSSMVHFKSIIRWENIKDKQKSQLPKAILPWMEKNALQRIPPYLPLSLLTQKTKVTFEPLDSVDQTDNILISFSVASSVYLIGIKFILCHPHILKLNMLHRTEHLNSNQSITQLIAQFSVNFTNKEEREEKRESSFEKEHHVLESTHYFKFPILLQDSVNNIINPNCPIRYIIELRNLVGSHISRRKLVVSKFETMLGENHLTVNCTYVFGIKELLFL